MKSCSSSSCRTCSPCIVIWMIAIIVLAVLAFLAPGCADTAAGAPSNPDQHSGRITITGASTVAPFIGDIAKRFEEQHPRVRVDVQTGVSSHGITDARHSP